MGVLIGFVFGYVVGAKTGAGSSERLREAWQGITESAELQGLVATASSFVESALNQGGAALTGYLERADGSNGRAADPLQKLLSGGVAMLGDLLDRGTAARR
jgi:cell division GTPase FtsZ